MADSTTLARPYAKAAFQYALLHDELATWSSCLEVLSQVATDCDACALIQNPASSQEQHIELFRAVLNKTLKSIPEGIINLLHVLAYYGRLLLIPDIKQLFEALKAEQEKTLTVEVLSFEMPDDEQQKRLSQMLGKRLNRQIDLNISIDPSILGGAIIQAGDLVIDGSVRGKLSKLESALTA